MREVLLEFFKYKVTGRPTSHPMESLGIKLAIFLNQIDRKIVPTRNTRFQNQKPFRAAGQESNSIARIPHVVQGAGTKHHLEKPKSLWRGIFQVQRHNLDSWEPVSQNSEESRTNLGDANFALSVQKKIG